MIRVSLMESGLPSSMLCDTRYILVLVCKMTEESFLGVLIAVVCAPISKNVFAVKVCALMFRP